MFCGNCGVELEEGAAFCQKCGTKVEGTVRPTVQINPASTEKTMNAVTTQQMTETAVYAKKKSAGNLIVIVVATIVAVVVIIGIVAVVAAFFATPPEYQETISATKEEVAESVSLVKDNTVETAEEQTSSEAQMDSSVESEEQVVQQLQDTTYYDIHRYELIVENVTWTQAWQACREKGGYLVHINSQEEYDAIAEQIFAEDKKNIIFWLGAIRGDDSEEYRWVDASGVALDEVLNNNPDYDSFWMSGEPSFHGDDLQETCVDMFYRSGEERFVWNDVPDDLIGVVSSYAGKVGYICEYED